MATDDPGTTAGPRFETEVLDRSVIALPLLKMMQAGQQERYHVIIDLNLEYPGGRDPARKRVQALLARILRAGNGLAKARRAVRPQPEQYVFVTLTEPQIRELALLDGGEDAAGKPRKPRSIWRIWPDFEVRQLLTKSVCTVKADAALSSFSTTGAGIVWAVMDSGIDALHPHFAEHDNLNLTGLSLYHRDLTTDSSVDGRSDLGALQDALGHGTHVAGIIAGARTIAQGRIVARSRVRDEQGNVKDSLAQPLQIGGIAPRCKLLSLKVLDDEGKGRASRLIAAITEIQRINGGGRYLRVHGVNMSVGYDFEPEWFACGQSPLCVEVNRLVKSGVAVVVAAGNTGYGYTQSKARGTVAAGLGLTINDPGNADLAVTVGSTHRDMPHVYGVSYFSSKGPTGDGRAKPDLVAPGEKIISCASGWTAPADAGLQQALAARVRSWEKGLPTGLLEGTESQYREDSGTSMAAPHVSGAIAAFLSVRREFIGQPERVKDIFLGTATDLKRDPYFQGRGLVDLMRAIQSV